MNLGPLFESVDSEIQLHLAPEYASWTCDGVSGLIQIYTNRG